MQRIAALQFDVSIYIEHRGGQNVPENPGKFYPQPMMAQAAGLVAYSLKSPIIFWLSSPLTNVTS